MGLKVGIIGCGKIADAHASQIQRVADCEIVAVCDREELMARQLAERFGVAQSFHDVNAFLERGKPDVVHITTPPQTHFDLARQCLRGGCHVYVEKPLALDAPQTKDLLDLCEQSGRKLTVGHDLQYSHVARRMRQYVQQGYLGGAPVHIESCYCYHLGQTGYAKALMGDKTHWVRQLPGKLLHNVISHGVARIAEFLTTEHPQVIVHGFVSPTLRGMGEDEIVDELRVIISEEGRTTAYFTFSSRMRPAVNQLRIFGPENGLLLDQDTETLIRLKGRRYKTYAEHFCSPLVLAKQCVGNVFGNVRRFLGNDFHSKAGMKYLIEAFYRSIINGGPVPIPYREILLTAWIMDQIFLQLAQGEQRKAEPELQIARAR